jgi:acyl carrier protein
MGVEQPTDDHVQGGTKEWTEPRVRALIGEIIRDLMPGTGELAPEARLIEELGFHSLALLELAFSLEDEFRLPTIDEATARTILTVQDVENYVVTQMRTSRRLSEDAAV